MKANGADSVAPHVPNPFTDGACVNDDDNSIVHNINNLNIADEGYMLNICHLCYDSSLMPLGENNALMNSDDGTFTQFSILNAQTIESKRITTEVGTQTEECVWQKAARMMKQWLDEN